jgi:hypothetical protein
MQMALPITPLQSMLQAHQSKPAPFANPAKSAAPAKEDSKAQTTANHFSVNYRSGIIRFRRESRRSAQATRKGRPPALLGHTGDLIEYKFKAGILREQGPPMPADIRPQDNQ